MTHITNSTRYDNDSLAKGRHSELIAITALLANGWTVLEPAVPEVYDLAIVRPGDTEIKRVQVKTASVRERLGVEWLTVTGRRNKGRTYSTDEVDYMIGVHDGVAYMFACRGITDYWFKLAELDAKTTKLDASIANIGEALQ